MQPYSKETKIIVYKNAINNFMTNLILSFTNNLIDRLVTVSCSRYYLRFYVHMLLLRKHS